MERDRARSGPADHCHHLLETGSARCFDQRSQQTGADPAAAQVIAHVDAVLTARRIGGPVTELRRITITDYVAILFRHQEGPAARGERRHFLLPEERVGRLGVERGGARSEEHTSELQSLMRISYAVFC